MTATRDHARAVLPYKVASAPGARAIGNDDGAAAIINSARNARNDKRARHMPRAPD